MTNKEIEETCKIAEIAIKHSPICAKCELNHGDGICWWAWGCLTNNYKYYLTSSTWCDRIEVEKTKE